MFCTISLMKRFFVILIVLLGLSGSSYAQSRIVDVDFDGLASVNESAARAYITSIEGTPYSAARVSEDIKKLYKAGLFSDVKASKHAVAGGIKLIFQVIENKTVGKLKVVGNKKLDDEEIQDALEIRENDLLDKSKIAESKRAIFSLYEEKGYHLADIKSRVEPFDEEKNQVELIFSIDENRPVKVRRIHFIGNKKFSDRKLRGKMKTKEKGFLSFITSSGKFKDEVISVDLQRLHFYYLDHGYLRARVDEPNVTLTRNKKAISIAIPVSEGEAYKVSDIGISGDILTSEEEILSKLSLKSGELYRKSLEFQDLQALERLYGDQAYAFASIVPQIEPDDATHTAKVTYHIQKGPKVKIGRIIIKGNKVTRDKVIRRELRVFENAYFSRSGLDMSRTRLQQLGYFEDINFSTPRSPLSENAVDLVVDVKERDNTGSFSIGAGFSTLESFIFTATIQKENFFGRGLSGGVSANISKLRQNFMIQMSDRYFLDSNWQFGFTLIRNQSQLNSFFDENRFGGSVKFGREVFDFFSVLVGYQIEDVSVSNFAAQVPAFFQANSSGLTSAVTSQVTYDRRDNRLFTTKGVYLTGTMDYSDYFLGASNNYVRYTTEGRLFFPLPKKFVLKGRGMFGYINSLDNAPIGLFDRFYLGGVNSLRGYDLSSVGPNINVPQTPSGSDTTFTYGGNKQVLFNVELEIPLYAPAGFQAVIFADAGQAFGESEDINFRSFRADYGFGFRWQSPFGPLRFEWGFPIDRREDESATVFNFTIGQSF